MLPLFFRCECHDIYAAITDDIADFHYAFLLIVCRCRFSPPLDADDDTPCRQLFSPPFTLSLMIRCARRCAISHADIYCAIFCFADACYAAMDAFMPCRF